MITSIEILNNNEFKFNDCLVISDINIIDDNLVYNLKYEETVITENEAKEISESCIIEIVSNILKMKGY